MKILIPALETRGDVQLYINLSVELSGAGFNVTIGTHPYWKETIESFSINFIPLGPDINIDIEAANAKKSFNIFSLIKMINNINNTASPRIIEILRSI